MFKELESKQKLNKGLTIYPFFKRNKVLLLFASLNGGNVLEKFVDSLIEWQNDLGLSTPTSNDAVWSKLIELSEKEINTDLPVIKPLIFAERYDINQFGSISNVKSTNLSIGSIFIGICKGIINNLNEIMTASFLSDQLKCKRIIATGGAFSRNKILRQLLNQSDYGQRLTIQFKQDKNDAAFGAAKYVSSK
jgi:hypothetical protein